MLLLSNERPSRFCCFALALLFVCIPVNSNCLADEAQDSPDEEIGFKNDIEPILSEHCFDCHADGAEEGGVSFDRLLDEKDPSIVRETWHRVLKQVRADLMPPVDQAQPSLEDVKRLESWIIRTPLELDPDHPNPGRLTVRRLNRVEYRNTIWDLLGVKFDSSNQFPADDTGHGFDNISDVLSISPLLLEKYFDAAEEIISKVVPTQSRVVAVKRIGGADFEVIGSETGNGRGGQLELSYYDDVTATAEFEVETSGDYQLNLNMIAVESYVDNQFDLNQCEFTFKVDGEQLLKKEFVRQGGKSYTFGNDLSFAAGKHRVELKVAPTSDEEQVRRLRLIVRSLDLVGPLQKEYYVKPQNYDRFFPKEIPDDPAGKTKYAGELLGRFASRAFRRPVDQETISRLAELAESTYSQEGETFESGIASGMTAILASPRFIFREEFASTGDESQFPLIDEYSLASRLSYFLWSSMPDQELMDLAHAGELRENLDQQVERMLSDKKFGNFVRSFAGQWLQARAIETVPISGRAITRREAKPDPEADRVRERFFRLLRKGEDRNAEEDEEFELVQADYRKRFRRGSSRVNLDNDIRRLMRRETEMSLGYVINENRSLLELINGNYTFLNERLAKFYQIDGVAGEAMRRFELPAESVRGGVLTQGTVLAVTSNPDRTSPVKRGLFVLENLLGTPTSAPPPNIPALEDLQKKDSKKLTLRESLELHRKDPQCSSCHNRMDPLGLALENFNAMGRFRNEELGQPIDSQGVLITGESFSTVSELKQILATRRKTDFFRCVTEKMLTYALGRAIGYEDIPVVDEIVKELEMNEGRAQVLVNEIVHSAAFQRIGTKDDEAKESTSNVIGE